MTAVIQRIPEKDIEKDIVTKAVSDIRRLMNSQSQLHDKLDADLVLIRKAFNERILYFRQLQEISDSVAEVEWEDPLANAIQEVVVHRAELDVKINTNRARHRYLVNLVNNKAGPQEADGEENVCILCRCDFIRGFITHWYGSLFSCFKFPAHQSSNGQCTHFLRGKISNLERQSRHAER